MHIWERKALHASVGMFIAACISYSESLATLLLLMLTAVALLLSCTERHRRIPFVSTLLDRMERPIDRTTLPGKGFICMLLGALIAIALFTQTIAAAAVIILAVGDSLSCITGTSIKRLTERKGEKAWEGAIFGTFGATLLAGCIIHWPAALCASGIALGIEVRTSSLKTILFDDNILVPIIAGVILTLIAPVI